MDMELFIPFFLNYGIIIAFLGGLIGGEEAILTLSFLSANSVLPLWWVIVFTTFGVYLSDIIVFYIGKIHLIHNFKKLEKKSLTYQKIDNVISKISQRKIFLTLLYTKFLYGTRVLTLLYLGIKDTDFRKFLIYDFLVVLIWLIPIATIGWLGGHGFRILLVIFKNVQLSITSLILFIIIFYLIRIWLKNILLKKRKQLN